MESVEVTARAVTGSSGVIALNVSIDVAAEPGAVIRAAHREFDRLIEDGLQGKTLLVRIEPDDERAALVAVVVAPKFSGFGEIAIFDEAYGGYVVSVSTEADELGSIIVIAE